MTQLTLGWPLARRAWDRLGESCVRRGVIDRPEDIYFLERSEVRNDEARVAQVTERRETWERNPRLSPPLVIGTLSKMITKPHADAVATMRAPGECGTGERCGVRSAGSGRRRSPGAGRDPRDFRHHASMDVRLRARGHDCHGRRESRGTCLARCPRVRDSSGGCARRRHFPGPRRTADHGRRECGLATTPRLSRPCGCWRGAGIIRGSGSRFVPLGPRRSSLALLTYGVWCRPAGDESNSTFRGVERFEFDQAHVVRFAHSQLFELDGVWCCASGAPVKLHARNDLSVRVLLGPLPATTSDELPVVGLMNDRSLNTSTVCWAGILPARWVGQHQKVR